eukprot:TRINITY_DN5384_c0_g1_i1.p1 TRINITY_DN5384_c0_g1~~TRINITY_DN5384_c0_g1_i1.p1  ORF type:complete len:542 (-),score=128.20 TRINITY_DN5384_c0_g1_i1:25-1650(-)
MDPYADQYAGGSYQDTTDGGYFAYSYPYSNANHDHYAPYDQSGFSSSLPSTNMTLSLSSQQPPFTQAYAQPHGQAQRQQYMSHPKYSQQQQQQQQQQLNSHNAQHQQQSSSRQMQHPKDSSRFQSLRPHPKSQNHGSFSSQGQSMAWTPSNEKPFASRERGSNRSRSPTRYSHDSFDKEERDGNIYEWRHAKTSSKRYAHESTQSKEKKRTKKDSSDEAGERRDSLEKRKTLEKDAENGGKSALQGIHEKSEPLHQEQGKSDTMQSQQQSQSEGSQNEVPEKETTAAYENDAKSTDKDKKSGQENQQQKAVVNAEHQPKTSKQTHAAKANEQASKQEGKKGKQKTASVQDHAKDDQSVRDETICDTSLNSQHKNSDGGCAEQEGKPNAEVRDDMDTQILVLSNVDPLHGEIAYEDVKELVPQDLEALDLDELEKLYEQSRSVQERLEGEYFRLRQSYHESVALSEEYRKTTEILVEQIKSLEADLEEKEIGSRELRGLIPAIEEDIERIRSNSIEKKIRSSHEQIFKSLLESTKRIGGSKE